ncbi:unnamed protein product, partial [Allacma fusca]
TLLRWQLSDGNSNQCLHKLCWDVQCLSIFINERDRIELNTILASKIHSAIIIILPPKLFGINHCTKPRPFFSIKAKWCESLY